MAAADPEPVEAVLPPPVPWYRSKWARWGVTLGLPIALRVLCPLLPPGGQPICAAVGEVARQVASAVVADPAPSSATPAATQLPACPGVAGQVGGHGFGNTVWLGPGVADVYTCSAPGVWLNVRSGVPLAPSSASASDAG